MCMNYETPAICLAALQRLNPNHAIETHAVLADILASLLKVSPEREQYIRVLETARPIAEQTQAILTRHYTAQSPVPGSPADDILKRVIRLWQAFVHSYEHIILSAEKDERIQKDEMALLMQRRMYHSTQILLAYFHAHRALPPGSWSALHRCYMEAVQHGVLRIRVSDPLNVVWKAQSTQEAHIAVLLVDLANPYSRTAKELRMIAGWAQRFAPYCRLDDKLEEHKTATYVLDPERDSSLRPFGLVQPHAGLKRFDSSVFAEQLEMVMTQLRQGIQPVALGLGRDCSADTCYRLLASLYRPWCLAAVGRRFPRYTNQGEAALSSNWRTIGFYLTGKVFQQPALYARRNMGEDNVMTEQHGMPDDLQPEEAWRVLDQSANGFRVQKDTATTAFEHNMLVSLRTHDNSAVQIGYVSRLLYLYDGRLEAGVQILSGKPVCVGIRITTSQTQGSTHYEEGFLLPAVETLKMPVSLVVPVNWFSPSRILDVYWDGKLSMVRLHQRLMRGNNFDLVSFEVVEQAKSLSVLEESAR